MKDAFLPQTRYLVFVHFVVNEFILPLLLEGDDDQGHEDVHEEEREHNEEDDIEDGHLLAVVRFGSSINFSCVNGVSHDAKRFQRVGLII